MKLPAAAALKACMALHSKLQRSQKDGTVTSFCEAFNHLLERYAADSVFAETGADKMCFIQSPNKSLPEYVEALWNKGGQ